MGKNQQSKKKLRAEKAKVKLKQSKTKFLPKGLNVTNTTFKIKPIVLPEQLKAKVAEDILSKRKLSINELLSRLKHYSANVRRAACEELYEIINLTKEEAIDTYISQICLAISALIQDKECDVRKKAVQVVRALLLHIPHDSLKPFYKYFSANLRCAMNNIDQNIQEDSLVFLDCFLDSNCEFIKLNSEKLLVDFLSLISQLRNDSNVARTVTVNLGSKMTSVTWRIKVLTRLHSFLKIVLESDVFHVDEAKNTSKFMCNTTNSTFAIYKQNYRQKLDDFDTFIRTSLGGTADSDILNKNLITMVPLLYETWLEVLPDKQISETEGTMLNDQSRAVLTCIVNTLYMLWLYIRKKLTNDTVTVAAVFLSKESRKFMKNILSNFPYSHTSVGGRKRKKDSTGNSKVLELNDDPKCVEENLVICFMYTVLYGNQNNVKNEFTSVSRYLNKLLKFNNHIKDCNVKYLLEILSEFFGSKSAQKHWENKGVVLEDLLESTIQFFEHSKINVPNKLKIFEVLCLDILCIPKLSSSEKYLNWINTLPNILCQPKITNVEARILLELSKRNFHPFSEAFLEKLPEFLDNFKNLEIIVVGNANTDKITCDMGKTKMELLFILRYINGKSMTHNRLIADFLDSHDDP